MDVILTAGGTPGTDFQVFRGSLLAPHAQLIINSRSTIQGAMAAQSINIEPDTQIYSSCQWPVLSNLQRLRLQYLRWSVVVWSYSHP